uniref:Uncharacterized protein n=1 Tax=Arundo donax TaxID=35708 RepID=A0A0A9GGC4_ARUDO
MTTASSYPFHHGRALLLHLGPDHPSR